MWLNDWTNIRICLQEDLTYYICNKTPGKTSWQLQKHSGWNLPDPLHYSITLAHACEKYETEHGGLSIKLSTGQADLCEFKESLAYIANLGQSELHSNFIYLEL